MAVDRPIPGAGGLILRAAGRYPMREAPLYPFIGPHTGAGRAPGTGKPPPRVPGALAAAVLLGFAAPACHGQAPGVLSLRAAVERALANSALLQAAGSAVRVAEQRTREAYGGVYPQVLAETSYLGSLGDRDQPRTGATALDHTVAASLRLNQTVLDVPAFRGLDAAQRRQRLRGEELRGAAHTLVHEVRQRYFDALLSREEERLTALEHQPPATDPERHAGAPPRGVRHRRRAVAAGGAVREPGRRSSGGSGRR